MNKSEQLIACLEGEIAKRDEELAACRVAVENCEVFRARIAELEARYQRDVYGLNNEGDPIGGDPAGGYANDNARLRSELAAIKAQGVVMPEPDFWLDNGATHCYYAEPLRALLSAPSPAGVDRLAVSSSGWFSLVMNAAAELETASYSITDPDAKRVAQSGADYYRSKAKSAQVVCISDAQATIDGLAVENHQLRRELNLRQSQIESSGRIAERAQRFAVQLRTERDQKAQRIGELEGLLREVHDTYRAAIHWEDLRGTMKRIAAALSAGKDSDQ